MAPSPRPAAGGGAPRALAELDPEEVLFVTLADGTGIAVRNDLRRVTTYVLIEQGRWFEHEWTLLPRLLEPGDTVFDVGANHGVYALPLARRVGPGGRVVAFEPGEDAASLLARSAAVAGLSWLDLRRAAVADRDGRAGFAGSGEAARLVDTGAGRELPCLRLDTVWRELGRPDVALLKIDVEGTEERVFAGGRELLGETSPVVMFEISGSPERAILLCRRLAAFGFVPHRYLPALDLLVPAAPEQCSEFQLNLLAFKPDRAAALVARGLLGEGAEPEAGRRVETPEAVAALLRDPVSLPASARLARVLAALRRHEPPFREEDAVAIHPGRALAYRLCTALGEMRRAARHLGLARRRSERELPPAAPLLAMSPWLDDVPPGAEGKAWMEIDLADRMLCGHNWSHRFLPTEPLAMIERLHGNPFYPPHLERRRQLRRTFLGLQPALDPGPATAHLRPDPMAGAAGTAQAAVPQPAL